jgi:hypothetical protein
MQLRYKLEVWPNTRLQTHNILPRLSKNFRFFENLHMLLKGLPGCSTLARLLDEGLTPSYRPASLFSTNASPSDISNTSLPALHDGHKRVLHC